MLNLGMQNQVLLEMLFKGLFAECWERGKMRVRHWSQPEILWGWTRSGAWCLRMKQMHLRHFGKKVKDALKGWGVRAGRKRTMEGDLELGRL